MPLVGAPHRRRAGAVDFNFHVRPILSDRCFKCHGPDDRARKASLRLDIKEIAFGDLPSGRRAIVAGRPGRSELVRRITSTDPKVMMPTPDSHLALDEVEKAILVRWIEQGAEWKTHWAFIRPVRPRCPTCTHQLGTQRDRSVRAGDARIEGTSPRPQRIARR